MSGSTPNQDIFDVRRIRRLVELMKEYDLSEVDLREGPTRIRLRRGAEPVITVAPRTDPAPPAAASPPEHPQGPAELRRAEDAQMAVIKSPIVGTFYAAPDPTSPPFVKVGDHVGPETVVCIVEAMKVFNQIPAEVSGTVVEVLAKNGDSVEFGQPLFRVRPG